MSYIFIDFSGEITSVSLKKSGLDDWMCDFVSITDQAQGNTCQFNFFGEKIGKVGVEGKLQSN